MEKEWLSSTFTLDDKKIIDRILVASEFCLDREIVYHHNDNNEKIDNIHKFQKNNTSGFTIINDKSLQDVIKLVNYHHQV